MIFLLILSSICEPGNEHEFCIVTHIELAGIELIISVILWFIRPIMPFFLKDKTILNFLTNDIPPPVPKRVPW